jgi:hypothetical protein
LFSGNGEWRARKATRKQVYAAKTLGVYVVDVFFDDVPGGPVAAEGIAGVWVDFYCRRKMKASRLKTESLTPASGANF